jgi:putative phage-type endonuclease
VNDVTIDRERFLGGSECPAANNLSPYQTPVELWAIKRKLVPPVTENAAMRWGHLLEAPVREETARVTGRTYRLVPKRIVHPVIAWAACHPDAISEDNVLYEGKTARTADLWGEPGTDQVPVWVTAQVQWNLACCGLTSADVAVLIGGHDHRVYTIVEDTELQGMLFDGARTFWGYVESGERPPMDYTAPRALDLVKKLHRGSTGEIIAASSALHLVRHEYEAAKEAKKQAEAAAEAAMAQMLDVLADGYLLQFEDDRGLRRQEVSRKGYEVKPFTYIDARFISTKGNK